MHKVNQEKCAPGINNDGVSCIQKLDILIELIRAYNEDNPTNKINIDNEKVIKDPLVYKK
jgi:hypothetical protein